MRIPAFLQAMYTRSGPRTLDLGPMATARARWQVTRRAKDAMGPYYPEMGKWKNTATSTLKMSLVAYIAQTKGQRVSILCDYDTGKLAGLWMDVCREAAKERLERGQILKATSAYLLAAWYDGCQMSKWPATTINPDPAKIIGLDAEETKTFDPGPGVREAAKRYEDWLKQSATTKELGQLEHPDLLPLRTAMLEHWHQVNSKEAAWILIECLARSPGSAAALFDNPNFEESGYQRLADIQIAASRRPATRHKVPASMPHWNTAATGAFFEKAHMKGWSLSPGGFDDLRAIAREAVDGWQALAGKVPDAVNDEWIRHRLAEGAPLTRLMTMLPLARGAAWTELLEATLEQTPIGWADAGTEFVKALKKSGTRNVAGVRRDTLVTLVASKEQDVRYEGLRLLAMIDRSSTKTEK